MRKPISRLFKLAARTCGQFVLGLIIVYAFADSASAWAQNAPTTESKTPATKLKELRLYPGQILLASSRSTQRLIVQGIYDNGYVDDVTSKAKITSANEGVIRLQGNQAIPVASGSTQLKAV